MICQSQYHVGTVLEQCVYKMTNEQTNKQRINKNKKFHVTEPFSKGLYNSLHLQMKFLRHLLGITKLDKEKNQCIRGKKGAQSVVKEIKQYQKKWLQHVQRTDTNRLPKQALQYRPKGRRNTGRPRKRWRDQLHLED